MNRPTNRLIIFTRYPVPGKTKTRLMPALGPIGAARLQEIMTGHTLLQARCRVAEHHAEIEVRFEGGDHRKMRRWLGPGIRYVPQGEGDLGHRMDRAVGDAFRTGAERVVLIGSDCPEMTADYLADAFDALGDHDLVIGPVKDGGYILIGLKSVAPFLFEGMAWGTDTVFEHTRAAACSHGMRIFRLNTLSDVDHPRDLPVWHRIFEQKHSAKPLSVIIPALNEESVIAAAVTGVASSKTETIVADGGSTDNTVKYAIAAGARTVLVPYGRAAQMNAAALSASGSILLFLHADTCLPPDFESDVLDACGNQNSDAGAFLLGIDADGSGFRLVESLANFRSRKWRMPYGDQAIFVRRNTFIQHGGYSLLPIMEDFELVSRLRQRPGFITLNNRVRTSSRRWNRLGIWRTTLINQIMIAGFILGVSPSRLASFYRNAGPKPD